MSALTDLPAEWWLWIALALGAVVLVVMLSRIGNEPREKHTDDTNDPWNFH